MSRYIDFKEWQLDEKVWNEFVGDIQENLPDFSPMEQTRPRHVYIPEQSNQLSEARTYPRERYNSGDPLTSVGGWLGSLGAGIGSYSAGVSGGGSMVAAVAGYFLGVASSNIITNRRSILMTFYNKLGVTTMGRIRRMYYDNLQLFINKHKLPLYLKTNSKSIQIRMRYDVLDNERAKIIIDFDEENIIVKPINTGGSQALDSIVYEAEKMDIGTKYTYSNEVGNVIQSAGGLNGILGRGYKIPRTRLLTYKKDLDTIWLIIVDMLSEMFADYAKQFADYVTRMQRTKVSDADVFVRARETLDLDHLFYEDAKAYGAAMTRQRAEADRIHNQRQSMEAGERRQQRLEVDRQRVNDMRNNSELG